MYADDILLLSPSVTVLQELLCVCENVLGSLDLSINPKKSVCTREGSREVAADGAAPGPEGGGPEPAAPAPQTLLARCVLSAAG